MERILYLDTSFRYLTVGISVDGVFTSRIHYEAWQQQSEKTVPEIVRALEESQLIARDLTQLVVAIGPGSYTGVRIGLTLAKVLAHALDLPLITLSTLQVIAGPEGNRIALLDARGQRAYVGVYAMGVPQQPDAVMTLEALKTLLAAYPEYQVVGDANLVEQNVEAEDTLAHMMVLARSTRPVENVHCVKPSYLKG